MKKISEMNYDAMPLGAADEKLRRIYFENQRTAINQIIHKIIDGGLEEALGVAMIQEIINQFYVHDCRDILSDRFLDSLIARFEEWEMFEDCAKCLKLKSTSGRKDDLC